MLTLAAAGAQVRRFIHVSSAVVQYDAPVLDESETIIPFSCYSRSKILGEEAVGHLSGLEAGMHAVRYRPPSVHARSRRVTKSIAKISRTPLGTVRDRGLRRPPRP